MATTQSLPEWAQQMAEAVQRRARAKEQRHQANRGVGAFFEKAYAKGKVHGQQKFNPAISHGFYQQP